MHSAFIPQSLNLLQELVAPLVQAVVAVGGLLVVGTGEVLDPVDEEVLVLLQDKELAKDHVRLKEQIRLSFWYLELSVHSILPS